MTTLAANKPRDYEIGDRNAFPIAAATIIYEGAAVGLDRAAGYARPLMAGDLFCGFAEGKADNRAGLAGAQHVRTIKRGEIVLSVPGAAITDVGRPVYASDDDTFTLTAGGCSLIGRVTRYESAGIAVVAFDANSGADVAPVITDNAANYDVLAADAGVYRRMTAAGAKTITFRPNATEALPIDGEWHFRNAAGSGNITLTPGDGVTLNPAAGGTLVVEPGMTITVKRAAVNVFDVIGQTVAA